MSSVATLIYKCVLLPPSLGHAKLSQEFAQGTVQILRNDRTDFVFLSYHLAKCGVPVKPGCFDFDLVS